MCDCSGISVPTKPVPAKLFRCRLQERIKNYPIYDNTLVLIRLNHVSTTELQRLMTDWLNDHEQFARQGQLGIVPQVVYNDACGASSLD